MERPITFSLDNTTLPAVITRDIAKLGKHNGNCMGAILEPAGLDSAVSGLENWAGNGHDLCSGNSNNWLGVISLGMLVYYCIDTTNSCGNLDTGDLKYALGQMDAVCPRYTASYYRWDGTPEIVGKAKEGANICV